MLLGKLWKRANWQGGLACIGSGTILGVAILLVPAVKSFISATFGGPAVAATLVSLIFGIVVSLATPEDKTPEADRLKAVFDAREGK